jgi:dihydrofolate synthase/folylpolyglutamate synthase
MNDFLSCTSFLFSHFQCGSASLPLLQKMCQFFDNPQNAFPSVHVAGTNGKGSVCLKIAKALEFSGYRTGLFTSPHIECYTERMMINGLAISKEEVVDGLSKIFSLCRTYHFTPTPFEISTLLSLLYFREHRVDVAVVETGMGGRLDATRIVNPVLSVITSISLDHTHVLGNTKEEIAKEKAGICRRGVPLVLGAKAQISTAIKWAMDLECPILTVDFHGGTYDMENQAVAKKALDELVKTFPNLTSSSIEQALLYRPSCRFEEIGSHILDVAHNPDGFSRLFSEVARRYPHKKICAIIGMSSDKDVVGCLSIATKYCKHIFLVQAEGIRAAKKESMAQMLFSMGYDHHSHDQSIESLIMKTCNDPSSIYVICGSFYVMSCAKKALASNQ